ncbi:MAG: SMP-30/gluconolactonase/LRE family protein [Candidatus Korobacteraceae bacterium]
MGKMWTVGNNSMKAGKTLVAAVLLLTLLAPSSSFADKKKKTTQPAPAAPAKPQIDFSKLAWPGPPNIPRVRYINYLAGQKFDTTPADQQPKVKQTWMDRLAGTQPDKDHKLKQMPFQLLGPNGMATDSKGNLFVADQRVGAIFIFNTETRDASLIRNKFEATFELPNGVAIDDDDRIFISDGKLHRVLILNAKHEVVDQIKEGLVDPVGLAIDTENRLLYVADTQLDQVVVFDADSLKKLRTIGTTGKNHELTTPGNFAGPTGVAVDKDGNVYVTDTMNFRVEIFDGDGKYISLFGQHCDSYGCFAHPKGIAVDSDGHIWVADPMLDILQIFNTEGQLLAFVGGHGSLPGQFSSLVDVYIDKQNRVFTSEQYPGRIQMFRYITDVEAEKLKQEKEQQRLLDRAAKTQPATAQAAEAKAPDAKPEEKKP